MEFRNLGNNILFLLGIGWERSKSIGPYQIELIYKKFSDIPNENISAELESLRAKRVVAIPPNSDRIYLTQKGISQIESLVSAEKKDRTSF
jgi:hypothetical protein